MKQLSTILNAVLLVAVAVLYILYFTGGKNQPNQDSPQGSVAAETSTNSLPKGAYAFIELDSLLRASELYKEMEKQVTAKGQELNQKYSARAQRLQQDLDIYQRNRQNLTIAQAKLEEETLTRRSTELQRYQQQLGQELRMQEQMLLDSIYNVITSYLDDYSKEQGINMILNSQRGGPVMFANQGMDITNQVINALNQDYQPTASDSTAAAQ